MLSQRSLSGKLPSGPGGPPAAGHGNPRDPAVFGQSRAWETASSSVPAQRPLSGQLVSDLDSSSCFGVRSPLMSMTVRELIEILSELPGDNLVVQSSDGEGNSFSPTGDVGASFYVAENTWSGYTWDPEEGETDAAAPSEAVPVVVLWPTN